MFISPDPNRVHPPLDNVRWHGSPGSSIELRRLEVSFRRSRPLQGEDVSHAHLTVIRRWPKAMRHLLLDVEGLPLFGSEGQRFVKGPLKRQHLFPSSDAR